MREIKGRLLRKKPYRVRYETGKNKRGTIIVINESAGLNHGDLIYEEILDNGIILIIPKKIYEENFEK